ncbi:MAG: hypothetical protein FWF69_01500 [Firmicutes bacterium]|nr:hypothetical protein [Bacillota bacterium]
MYLKKTRNKATGRIYLSIVEGYWDKERGHTRTKTIESIGYVLSQTVRGASEEMKAYILSEKDYKPIGDKYKRKSRIIPVEIQYHIWIMVQHWESMEQLKAASDKMFKDSAAEPFVKSLNPESVKITIAPQIQMWK